MCFNETVSIVPSKPVDEEEDPVDGDSRSLVRTIPTIAHHSIMYAPKCLVLVSRLDYIETFRVRKTLPASRYVSMYETNVFCIVTSELPWYYIHCVRRKSQYTVRNFGR